MSTRRPSRSSSEENSCWTVHTRYLVSSAAACHFKEQRRRVSIPNRQQHGQTLTLLLFLLLSILLILEDFALPQPLYNQPPSPVPHQTALLLGDWRGWIGCPHPRWQSLSLSHTHCSREEQSCTQAGQEEEEVMMVEEIQGKQLGQRDRPAETEEVHRTRN